MLQNFIQNNLKSKIKLFLKLRFPQKKSQNHLNPKQITNLQVMIVQLQNSMNTFIKENPKRHQTQDLRKLDKIRKISKLTGDRASCPISLPVTKLWSQWSKITQRRQILKNSGPVQFCLTFLLCSKSFAQDFQCLFFLGRSQKYAYQFLNRSHIFYI